jgi:signal peptidase
MAETSEASYESFNEPGSVIVYDYPGRVGSPIIHRVRFQVNAGENWYHRASPDAIDAESCAELTNCPAPHAGYITKGDNNRRYDQANGVAPVVKPDWINGVARFRIPYLGRLRLVLLGTAHSGAIDETITAGTAATGGSEYLTTGAGGVGGVGIGSIAG